MTHSQKGNALVCGLSTRKIVTPMSDPVKEDAFQLFPHPGPVFAFKIEGIDVLVFLRRILGVLNRAIGPLLEPGLVLVYIRMVRRDLECDVKRDR